MSTDRTKMPCGHGSTRSSNSARVPSSKEKLVVEHAGRSVVHAGREHAEHGSPLDARIALHHRASDELVAITPAVPASGGVQIDVAPIGVDDLDAI